MLIICCFISQNWFKNKRSRVLTDSKSVSNPTINSSLMITPQSKTISSQISPVLRINHTANESLKSNDYSNGLNVTVNETNNNNSSNSNLNGLLNIVKSINNPSKVTINKLLNNNQNDSNSINVTKTNENKKVLKNRNNNENSTTAKNTKNKIIQIDNSMCLKCSTNSKILCTCNISKMALNRLYRNYSGFINASNLDHSISNINQNRKPNNFVISYERFEMFEAEQNVEKIFQVL
jgi:hypothetical protein